MPRCSKCHAEVPANRSICRACGGLAELDDADPMAAVQVAESAACEDAPVNLFWPSQQSTSDSDRLDVSDEGDFLPPDWDFSHPEPPPGDPHLDAFLASYQPDEVSGWEDPGTNRENRKIVPEGQRRCPVCSEYMESRRMHEIQVDLCPSHGVWLDSGELSQVASRMHAQSRAAWVAMVAQHEPSPDSTPTAIDVLADLTRLLFKK